MKKIIHHMSKAMLCISIFLFCRNSAQAFVFTDVAAHAQRVQMISQTASYIRELNSYRNEFNRYKSVFDSYYQTFHSVYRRLSAADWNDFVPSSWNRLDDHFIRIWKTFDEGAWLSQVLALKAAPNYTTNPDYRTYADSLIDLSEEQMTQLKQEEAHLIELQEQDRHHRADLEKFKSRNAALAVGDPSSEVALSQQIALTNAILIEIASIQAESKIVEQRLLTGQREQRNLIARMKQLELQARSNDIRNLERLISITKIP